MDLHDKSESKESLTEHLYTVIYQNEIRKAKKLAELMKQLEMIADDEPEVLEVAIPHPSLVSPVQLPIGRFGGPMSPPHLAQPPDSVPAKPKEKEAEVKPAEATKESQENKDNNSGTKSESQSADKDSDSKKNDDSEETASKTTSADEQAQSKHPEKGNASQEMVLGEKEPEKKDAQTKNDSTDCKEKEQTSIT